MTVGCPTLRTDNMGEHPTTCSTGLCPQATACVREAQKHEKREDRVRDCHVHRFVKARHVLYMSTGHLGAVTIAVAQM